MSVLARACLVDFDGEVIYDEYVRPESFVTDFRTKYSGRKEGICDKLIENVCLTSLHFILFYCCALCIFHILLGVRKKNLREGKAVSFQECINAVHSLIKGKILVGHAVHNDLAVLHLQNIHQANIRDTARYH